MSTLRYSYGKGAEIAPAQGSETLSEVLFHRSTPSFANFAVLRSNVEAVEACLLFANRGHRFVAIGGPSGWGKTHLLDATAFHMERLHGIRPEVRSAEAFLTQGGRFDQPEALLLDDCQLVASRPRLRLSLQYVLEQRVRTGKPTLLAYACGKCERPIMNMLPSKRSWIVGRIEPADIAEKASLLTKLSNAEDVHLSAALTKVLATRLHGNGRTLVGALRRLRLERNDWSERDSTLRACGVLDPFFADNSSWDLRHRIYREAERRANEFYGIKISELSAYTMLFEADLNEQAVAQYLNCAPAEAYLSASRFRRVLEDDESMKRTARKFVEYVIDSITR